MKIMEIRALRGPNYYSNDPVIFLKLDIQELESKPTDLVPNFKEKISSMIPTLYEHKCSIGTLGGFYQRLIRGTWAGHVIEHVAIELQSLSGFDVVFGKTFSTNENGVYNVVYNYIDENVGLRAGEISVEIIEKLFKGIVTDVQPFIKELKEIAEDSVLGPSTLSIVNEASRRGIPYIRLNEYNYVQLGQGKYQRRIQATMMDNTSAIGVEIADDKGRTKTILSSMGIPVAKGIIIDTEVQALKAAEDIGYPLVMKPLIGNHGRGITINILTQEELILSFNKAKEVYDTCLVEKYLEGLDFRILVINGKFVAAACRKPAYVIGNGVSTIQQLIENLNKDEERGIGHGKNLTKVTIDDMTEMLLAKKEYTLESILAKGDKIQISTTSNLSAGGISKDVTGTVHPLNKAMAERISNIIGLNVMGIDVIADSLEQPLINGTSAVLEVNAAPGFRMHLNPQKGNSINIASNVVDMLFPHGSKHSVPIVAVTGTNGKTTTTRIIEHILRLSGSKVGMTSTDTVNIDAIPILTGDYSGPEGVLQVLTDSRIDHAVFEIARGGILRRGLGFKECDIGVFLNISSDHIGDGGIMTLEDLTRLKSTVTEVVKPSGYAVFNADDPYVVSCIDKTKAHPILFSKDPLNKEVKANYEKGNTNVLLLNNNIIVQNKLKTETIVNVIEVPITFNGTAEFNIENVLAAVAVTTALGLTKSNIKRGLLDFNSSIDHSRGRMNLIDLDDFKVLIDYGHNPGAIMATGAFIKGLMPGKVIRMVSSVGNRTEENILEFGMALSKYSDKIVICDPDPRNRVIGETANIVKQGLIKGGLEIDKIKVIIDEREATKAALEMATRGDLVVLQVDNINQVITDVLNYKTI